MTNERRGAKGNGRGSASKFSGDSAAIQSLNTCNLGRDDIRNAFKNGHGEVELDPEP